MEWRWHKYRIVLETESGLLLFNLLNKSVLRIDKRIILDARLSGDFRPFEDESLNRKLSELNFIIPKDITDGDLLSRWYHSLCDNTQAFEWLLLLTAQCNFACRYCFQEADPTFRTTTETYWPQIIHWLTDAILQRRPRSVRVSFFGGEPLLELNLLEQVSSTLRAACETVGSTWRCDLVTNGYGLSDQICLRLINHGLKRIQITLDGPPEIHNVRRALNRDATPTFERILESIELATRHRSLECLVRTNIDAHNTEHYAAMLDILARRGLTKMVCLSIVPTQRASQTSWDWNSFCFSSDVASRHLASCIREAVRRGFRVTLRSLESGPCIALARGGLVVEPNGNLYKCHHLASDQSFLLGNIAEGAPISILDVSLASPWRQCVNCRYVPVCLGGCRYEAIQRTQRPLGRYCATRDRMRAVIPTYLSQYLSSEYGHDREELIGKLT